jgi:hypothetical protein
VHLAGPTKDIAATLGLGFMSSSDSSVAGVRGLSTEAFGNAVIGEANNGSVTFGVWGIRSYAGYFSGNIRVLGSRSEAAKTL